MYKYSLQMIQKNLSELCRFLMKFRNFFTSWEVEKSSLQPLEPPQGAGCNFLWGELYEMLIFAKKPTFHTPCQGRGLWKLP